MLVVSIGSSGDVRTWSRHTPTSLVDRQRCSRQTIWLTFFFQAEEGIRDLVRCRGLGDVYKRQEHNGPNCGPIAVPNVPGIA